MQFPVDEVAPRLPADCLALRDPASFGSMRRRRRFRGWVLLWALLQFAAPSGAAYADALLERAGVDAPVAHVESHTDATCRPVHASDCALCHLVQHRIAPSGAPSCIPESSVHRGELPDRHQLALVAADRGRLPLPRAPPL